mmetsp:Transcript_79758/g.97632  ORF Transcript_79758/g.97632 Transcript_79758/m.97632 type:complete len:243 (-) Transcript_79758:191-919(-)
MDLPPDWVPQDPTDQHHFPHQSGHNLGILAICHQSSQSQAPPSTRSNQCQDIGCCFRHRHGGRRTRSPGWQTGQVLLLDCAHEGMKMEPWDTDVGIQMYALPLWRSAHVLPKDLAPHRDHLGEQLLSVIRAVLNQPLDITEALHRNAQDITGMLDIEKGCNGLGPLQGVLTTMKFLALRQRCLAIKVAQTPPTIKAEAGCRTGQSRDIGAFAQRRRTRRGCSGGGRFGHRQGSRRAVRQNSE